MDLRIKPSHAYVLATLLGAHFVHWVSMLQHVYMSFAVMKARKQYNVPYPQLYADASNKDGQAFNCIQRGQQNSFENLPTFLAQLLLVGLRFPVSAAVAGVVYLIGRVLYFQGYCTADPESRKRGNIMHIGSVALLVMLGRFAWELYTS